MRPHVLFLAALLALVDSAPKEVGHVKGGACRWIVDNITSPNPSQYLPQCDINGNFERRQCWESLGVCWCVNPVTGGEIPGTKSLPGDDLPDCEAHEDHEDEDGHEDEDEDGHEDGHMEKKKSCCPEHWTEFEDHCYIYIDSPKNWMEAESYCQFEEGHLASIHGPKMNHFLQILTKGNTHDFPESWVGGTNAVAPCFWMWSDGSRFDFQEWSSEKAKTREDSCLTINYGCNTNHMLWGASCCTETRPFVCSKEIERPEPEDHHGHY